MIWNSTAEFLEMGGYAQYVWGSVIVTAMALLVELFLLRKRRKRALLLIQRELVLNRDDFNENSA